VLADLRKWLFPQWTAEFNHYRNNTIWLSLLAGLRGGITIGGMAAAIKLMKYWYVKEQRNLELQKENTESQLQLLKAQIHPHFLFNTLNNIYSYTQGNSPTASKLVMGLGDMLRYMLYECNQPMVPLEMELQMLKDYILLEKIRYGNSLDVHVDVPKESDGLLIAPLLLLPFVENCFKHGASHMIDQPWVNLYVSIEDAEMRMKLLNGKPVNYQPINHTHGIGIGNVRKRLELLYPGKFSLDIREEEDVFIVNLRLELEKRKVVRDLKPKVLVATNA
jgi:LytS/YehU family sensor histidine kinase